MNPETFRWYTPGRNQGQIVTVSYSFNGGDLWRRTSDASWGTVAYFMADGGDLWRTYLDGEPAYAAETLGSLYTSEDAAKAATEVLAREHGRPAADFEAPYLDWRLEDLDYDAELRGVIEQQLGWIEYGPDEAEALIDESAERGETVTRPYDAAIDHALRLAASEYVLGDVDGSDGALDAWGVEEGREWRVRLTRAQ